MRESELDLTIVRLPILNDGPRTGKVRAGFMGQGEVETRIARADIADFILRHIEDPKYVRQAPLISNCPRLFALGQTVQQAGLGNDPDVLEARRQENLF